MKTMERCPSWCTDAEQAGWPPDHVHTSEEHHVPLSLTQFVAPSAGWNVHGTEVYTELWRVHDEETAVLVVMDDDIQIQLTVTEARRLAQHITNLCDEASVLLD